MDTPSLSDTLRRSRLRWRAVSSGVALALYVIAFFFLHASMGKHTVALAILPLLVVSYSFGRIGGAAIGLLLVPLDAALLMWCGCSDMGGVGERGFWAVHSIFLAISLSVGCLSELFLQLQDELSKRIRAQGDLNQAVDDLRAALDQVNTLRGLLPICSACKKVRDDDGYWQQIETYVQEHSHAQFTHGLCPRCTEKLYPELADVAEFEDTQGVQTPAK